jgi:putative DNA primase/helicase
MKAETIARDLGGRKVGAGWMARCPAHDDREPSLSIRDGDDGKVLVRCHAGCKQGQLIAALRSRGLWAGNDRRCPPSHRATADGGRHHYAERINTVLAIWESATPADGTPIQTYLASRGPKIAPPPTLRFHAGLKHPSGSVWPAMVALVTGGADDTPVAVQRTFLDGDASGKAPVAPQKMMLGPCRAGAVRLGAPHDELMVGEGIETCLAVMQATGRPAWAALSTSGLKTLELPDAVRSIIVLADGDDPGEAAAWHAALRWRREGRRVRIARPPWGLDFNDVLMRSARQPERTA